MHVRMTKRKYPSPTHTKPSRTVIIGDSIISTLVGWRMSKKSCRVVVRSFVGAKVDDTKHNIRHNILKHKPDNIIVHIRTNNLKNDSPREMSEKVFRLCKLIEEESPHTKIGLSELPPRSDSKEAESARTLDGFTTSQSNTTGVASEEVTQKFLRHPTPPLNF